MTAGVTEFLFQSNLSGWNARLNSFRAQTVWSFESTEEVVLELANICCLASSDTCVSVGKEAQTRGWSKIPHGIQEKEAVGFILN